uniref:CSON007662 protein n=1 Tax=Culicoides sonorensis TaxID=179676 RepID=A0A336KHR5_CULSO
MIKIFIRTYPGGFSCMCKPEFHGYFCDIPKNQNMPMANSRLSWNRIMKKNHKEHFLLTAKSIGNLYYNITFSPYQIFGKYNTNSDSMRKTRDLRKTCMSHGIHDCSHLDREEGFYVAFETVFNKTNNIWGGINVYHSSSDAVMIVALKMIFRIKVIDVLKECIPSVQFPDRTTVERPLKLSADKKVMISPFIETGCPDVKSSFEFEYEIRSIKNEIYHKFSKQKTKDLILKPYQVSWYTDDEILIIWLRVTEILDSTNYSKSIDTYIFVEAEAPLIAYIKGGMSSQVKEGNSVLLDGRKSRDLKLDENVDQKLNFKWKCDSKDIDDKYCKDFSSTNSRVTIPKNELKLGFRYNFQLLISKDKRNSSTTQSIEIVKHDPLTIEIKCIKNCLQSKSNIDHFIHLQAVCHDCINMKENDIQVEWYQNDDKLIGTGTRLIYHFHKDIEDETIVEFKAKVKFEKKFGENKFKTVITKFNENDVQCRIEPDQGIALVTKFNITCENIQKRDMISMKIYQNDIFLTETQQNSVLLYLIDSNSNDTTLKVVVKNSYDARIEKYLKVNLESVQIEKSTFYELIDSVEHPSSIRNAIKIGDQVKATEVFNSIVTKLKDFEYIEEKTSLTGKLVISMNSLIKLKIDYDPTLVNYAMHHLTQSLVTPYDVSSKISEIILDSSSKLKHLSEDEIIKNANIIIEILDKISQKSDDLAQPIEDYVDDYDETLKENYQDYGDLDIEIIEQYMNVEQISMNVEKISEHLLEALVLQIESGEPEKILKRNSTYFFKTMDLSEDISKEVSNRMNTSIKIDEKLLKDSTKNSLKKYGICVSFYKQNPFWWYPYKNLNVSDVCSINIIEQDIENVENKRFIHNLRYPISVFFEITPDLRSEISDVIENELDMPSYAFLLPMNETLNLKFSINPPNSILKVGFALNRRPKHQEVVSHYYEIHDGTEVMYKTENLNLNKVTNFIHMAIISSSNTSIKFNFTASAFSCVEWNKETSHWSTEYTKISRKINDSLIECQFSHLSSIAKSQHKLTIKRYPIRTFPNVLIDNQVILYLIAVLLGSFIIFMSWGYVEDRKDVDRRTAIILPDNNPQHHYTYLVIIQTGSDPDAGTSSRVCIQLKGETQNSQKHLLNRSTPNLFERFRESSFIIKTPGSLGKILEVLLWHDNSGINPSWYCHSVIVRDIAQKKEYVFLAQRWISLLKSDRTSAHIKLASEKEFYDKESILKSNKLFIMQNQLFPYNLIFKHPRSNVTRTENILSIFQRLFVSMTVNIVLFGRSTTENLEDEVEKYDHFGHYGQIFLTSLISSIICTVINYPLRYVLLNSSMINISPDQEKYEVVFLKYNSHDNPEDHESKMEFWSHKVKILWYVISSIICLTCIIIIIIYGYHFGNIKFLMWTISVCIAAVKNHFIFVPIFTYVQLHWLKINVKRRLCYWIPVIIKQKVKEQRSKLELLRLYAKMKVKRYNDKSYKISSKFSNFAKKLTHEKYELRELISDLFMFVTFFVTLNVLILGTRDSNIYYSTKMIENMFVHGKYSPMKMDDVTLDRHFWNYLNKTLIPVIHLGTEHNNAQIEDELGWLPGRFAKILGVAQLLQIRVKNTKCKRQYLSTQEICQSELADENRDTENYFPNWTDYHDFHYEPVFWKIIQPWKYKKLSLIQRPPIFAVDHWHSGGGYITEFGRTYKNTMYIYNHLYKYNWIDSRTRAVFIDFTVYNADSDIFNVVNLIFERNAAGEWQKTFQIQSCKFLFYFGNMSTLFVIVFVLFVILTARFFLKLSLRIFKHTVSLYFKDVWNITDTMIVIMSVQIVMLFIKRNHDVEKLLKEVEKAKNNEFISFSPAATLDTLISIVSGILICFSTIRLWKILLFAQVFRLFNNTLYRAHNTILSCGIMISIFLFGYSMCVYIINGTHSEVLHNLWSVLPTITAISFGMEPFDFDHLMYGGTPLGTILYIAVFIIITLFLVNMFITIIIFYFNECKEEDRNSRRLYTIWHYIVDRSKIVKARFTRKKLKSDTDQNPNERLRGGAASGTLGDISEVADTIDAQLSYLEEYFKEMSQKKKIQSLNPCK